MPGALHNGIRLTLTLDPQAFTGNSRLLFAGIVARFLARNATANCFVRTVLLDEGRSCRYGQTSNRPR